MGHQSIMLVVGLEQLQPTSYLPSYSSFRREKVKKLLQPASYLLPKSGRPPIHRPLSPTSGNSYPLSHPARAATPAPSRAGWEATPAPSSAGRFATAGRKMDHLALIQ
ncbi:unnamed protein product [Urochloa humidicola]